jgi:carboxyl-terminal processing protease
MKKHLKTGLIMGLMALVSACSLAPDADPTGEQERIFETFYNDVRLTYPFFPFDGVDWDASYKQYRPQVVAATADSTLFRIMSQMMTPLMEHILSRL